MEYSEDTYRTLLQRAQRFVTGRKQSLVDKVFQLNSEMSAFAAKIERHSSDLYYAVESLAAYKEAALDEDNFKMLLSIPELTKVTLYHPIINLHTERIVVKDADLDYRNLGSFHIQGNPLNGEIFIFNTEHSICDRTYLSEDDDDDYCDGDCGDLHYAHPHISDSQAGTPCFGAVFRDDVVNALKSLDLFTFGTMMVQFLKTINYDDGYSERVYDFPQITMREPEPEPEAPKELCPYVPLCVNAEPDSKVVQYYATHASLVGLGMITLAEVLLNSNIEAVDLSYYQTIIDAELQRRKDAEIGGIVERRNAMVAELRALGCSHTAQALADRPIEAIDWVYYQRVLDDERRYAQQTAITDATISREEVF